MATNRINRINEDIQRELADLLSTVKDPRVQALNTNNREDTTTDLRYCRVYVSALDQSDIKEVVKGLKSAAGYLRRELGRALTLRYTPELQFMADDSIERGVRMVSMIDRILEEDEEK